MGEPASDTSAASAPPTLLAERWELLDRLGEGAMGEVWRGRHKVLGHEVAIKIMKRAAAGEQQLIARFLREAQIAARLRHRNIARVEDFGTSPEGRPFLVMELLRGRSLEAVLQERGTLDRQTVAIIAQHVGAACDVAHAVGIVHRDLKPENCHLVRDEDGAELVKVLDFGVAKVTDGLLVTHHGDQGTASFALLGTPMYMSPEQARGQRDIDFRSDLWSLAVMLYELLLGRLPCQAETLPQLLFAVLSEPIPLPSSIDPTLSPSVDAWAARAFDRDRERRFQSGRELASALTLALGETPRASLAAPRPSQMSIPPTVPEFAAATLHPHAMSPSPLLHSGVMTVAPQHPATIPMPQASLAQMHPGPMPTFAPRRTANRSTPVMALLAAGVLFGVLATVGVAVVLFRPSDAPRAAQPTPVQSVPNVPATPVVVPHVPLAPPQDPPPVALQNPPPPREPPPQPQPLRPRPPGARPSRPQVAPLGGYIPPPTRTGGSYNPDEP